MVAQPDDKKTLKILRDLGVSLNSTLNFTEMQRIILDALTSISPIDAACIHVYSSSLDQIAFESAKGFSHDDLSYIRGMIFTSEPHDFLKKGTSLFSDKSYLSHSGSSLSIIPCVYLGETLGALIVGTHKDNFPLDARHACELTATRTSSILRQLRNEDSLKQVNRELEKVNDRVRVSEERYRAVVEDHVDLICRYTPSFEISFANISFRRYFGIDTGKIDGLSFLSFIHTEDRSLFLSHIRALSANVPGTVSYRVVSADGSHRWVEWTDRAISPEKGTVSEYQSVGRDVTERKLLEDRLRYMSMHDYLTGLYNRAYFDEQMKRFSDPRFIPVGIIVVDLNALKIVNDAIGHQQGDILLLSAADVLTSCFRGSDTIARIGGDEFAVLLPNTDEKTTRIIIERVKHTIQERREKNPDTPLSIAIGYAIRTRKSSRMEEVFAEADDMMYREKDNQRDFARGLVLTSLVREIERSDPYRGQHMIRVQNYCMSFANELGISQGDRGKLSLASRYHDIGMIGVDKQIMTAAQIFSHEERETAQRHSEIGARIADAHPFLNDISELILYHHERWNGTGYPLQLKAEKIPLLSRIIALCDSFDAMTTHILYRPIYSTDMALEEIDRNSGVLFDPVLSQKFIALVKKGSVLVKTDR
jgi:diguanylate cyclase (GGDEF)-like protein/PAS domain S-box-containing protein